MQGRRAGRRGGGKGMDPFQMKNLVISETFLILVLELVGQKVVGSELSKSNFFVGISECWF